MQNKKKNIFGSKNFMLAVSFLGLYLLSVGTTVLVLSLTGKGAGSVNTLGGLAGARGKIAELPKDQECPINGQMMTKVEREIWEERRPLVAMIENHVDSRPVSGISYADVVYEAVAEGGITRFAAVFYCNAASAEVKVAPIRSARVYYIDWASEYGDAPIYIHVGGANDFAGYGDTAKEAQALEMLARIGWRYKGGNDFDAAYDSGYPVMFRNPERLGHQVAYEHTMMANLDLAYEEAANRGFAYKGEDGNWDENYRSWLFKEGNPSSNPDADEISFEFWEEGMDSELYAVTWLYDPTTNTYVRENGSEPFIDHETGEQIRTSNVVILFTEDRRSVDRNKHVLYTTTGQGDALIYHNGTVTEATWEKEDRTDRTVFTDSDGEEIEFVRGKIWIEVLSDGNDVDY